jgi:naphthalene 1,2-dioxygenase system ferredoxin subunit
VPQREKRTGKWNFAVSDNWHEVAAEADVAEDEPIRIYVDKDEIALFNVGGEIFATGNICTHAMASMHRMPAA